jgi:hypothetical protein
MIPVGGKRWRPLAGVRRSFRPQQRSVAPTAEIVYRPGIVHTLRTSQTTNTITIMVPTSPKPSIISPLKRGICVSLFAFTPSASQVVGHLSAVQLITHADGCAFLPTSTPRLERPISRQSGRKYQCRSRGIRRRQQQNWNAGGIHTAAPSLAKTAPVIRCQVEAKRLPHRLYPALANARNVPSRASPLLTPRFLAAKLQLTWAGGF